MSSKLVRVRLFVYRNGSSIISLIANVSRSSEVMAEVFSVMRDAGVQVTNCVHPGLVVASDDEVVIFVCSIEASGMNEQSMHGRTSNASCPRCGCFARPAWPDQSASRSGGWKSRSHDVPSGSDCLPTPRWENWL